MKNCKKRIIDLARLIRFAVYQFARKTHNRDDFEYCYKIYSYTDKYIKNQIKEQKNEKN